MWRLDSTWIIYMQLTFKYASYYIYNKWIIEDYSIVQISPIKIYNNKLIQKK